MKQTYRSTVLIWILLLAGLTSARAQSANLLTNPGFEPPFVEAAGSPPPQVAEGWTAWYDEQDGNIQPEYYAASDESNGLGAPRIHSGEDAQQYFTYFAGHRAGVYQTVSGITPGEALRFSVYAYLWSSAMSDADVSEMDGGLLLEVGIDPTGGTDASSDAVVWSTPAQIYDDYAEYAVTAAAEAESVTVFVRSTVAQPVANNVIYLDDASLTAAGGESQAAIGAQTLAAPTVEVATIAPLSPLPT